MSDAQQWNAGYPGQPPVWTPPPKPGLIPLRPLSFGTILGAPYQLLRRNPKATFGSGLLIQAVVAIASAAIIVPLLFILFTRLQHAARADQETILAGAVGWSIVAGVVILAVSVFASALLQGVIVLEVARATLGEKLSLGALWKQVLRRLLPLAAWLVMFGGAFTIVIGILVAIAIPIFAQGGFAIAIGVLYSILALLGLLVLWAWLATKTLFVPCAIVLEKLGIRASVARSWTLTRGAFWRTFGTYALVVVILYFASQVVTAPVGIIGQFAIGSFDPNHAANTFIGLAIVQGISLFLSIILGAITAVVQSATVALLYIDLRMRREGLDLELLRFVEAREAGYEVIDPYLPRTA